TVTVDLLAARLASHHTTVDVGAVFGEVKILVPEGIRVHIDTDGSFGETTFKVARGAIPPEQLPANAPPLRITGSHILGSVTVRVLRLDYARGKAPPAATLCSAWRAPSSASRSPHPRVPFSYSKAQQKTPGVKTLGLNALGRSPKPCLSAG